MQLPLGVFGVAIAMVTLPAVSRLAAHGITPEFGQPLEELALIRHPEGPRPDFELRDERFVPAVQVRDALETKVDQSS